jgi:hypothetical protein
MVRSPFLPFFFLLAMGIQAQDRTENGHLLNWNTEITVGRSTVVNGKYELPAFTFTVFEADGRAAAAEWTAAYRSLGGKVKGSGPYKGTGARLEGLNGPATMLTTITQNKKQGSALVEVTLMTNDSTPAPNWGSNGEKVVRDLAVRMNQGVVQKQIDEQQKHVDQLAKDLASAQKVRSKAAGKHAEASAELEQVRKERDDLTRKQADLAAEEIRLQARYPSTKDPADLVRLHRVQKELPTVRKALDKQQQKEADAKQALDRKADSLPGPVGEEQEMQARMDKAMSELEALTRKKEMVK